MATKSISLSGLGADAAVRAVQIGANGDDVHLVFRSSDPVPAAGFARIGVESAATTVLTDPALRAAIAAEGFLADIVLSGDGRFAAVSTGAALTADDANGVADVYRIDLDTGAVARASLSDGGAQGGSRATNPAISTDGSAVAFSTASTLTPGDDAAGDVHVRDFRAARLVNLGATVAGNHLGRDVDEDRIALSANGRRAAFATTGDFIGAGVAGVILADAARDAATDVLATLRSQTRQGLYIQALGAPALSGDGSTLALQTNGALGDAFDGVFLLDAATGAWRRVVRVTDPGRDSALDVDISADGRFVAYATRDARQVSDDLNGVRDVFVTDVATGRTVRASLDAGGRELTAGVAEFDLSEDGSRLAFTISEDGSGNGTALFVADGAGLWLSPDGAALPVALRGTARADSLEGGRWDETLTGGLGSDRLSGAAGDDLLRGGAEGDRLLGGAGADTLEGGRGADTLAGGAGADVFLFAARADSTSASRDVLVAGGGAAAFQAPGARAGDLIDLSSIDADATAAGVQDLRFGEARGVGRLWAVDDARSTDTIVFGNLDRDAAAELAIVIRDGAVRAAAYAAADFLV